MQETLSKMVAENQDGVILNYFFAENQLKRYLANSF
jgi:hypothetical protein